MSFEINPCNAVLSKTEASGNCNINELNNLCYGICDAFNRPSGCRDKCALMIDEKKKQLGRNNCNLQRPKPPVDWKQVPHYFPRLLKQTDNIRKSQLMCHELCKNNRYPNSCIDMCNLDSMSVRDTRPSSHLRPKTEEEKEVDVETGALPVFKPWIFWPFFILFSIFMIYIISVFIRILYLEL